MNFVYRSIEKHSIDHYDDKPLVTYQKTISVLSFYLRGLVFTWLTYSSKFSVKNEGKFDHLRFRRAQTFFFETECWKKVGYMYRSDEERSRALFLQLSD